MQTRLFLTGASGFIGKRIEHAARSRGFTIERARSASDGGQFDLQSAFDLRPRLRGVDTVIHTAARVHIMRDDAGDPLAAFRAMNVEGTLRLARQAAAAGVRRFVFLSSIKVNGEMTHGTPFTASDTPAPQDPYGQSKLEAEAGLERLALETGMEVTIIRPPLVYGPDAKGNFATLVKWVRRGVPLPLSGLQNRRSLVAVDNLADLVLTTVQHPAAANKVFLVSDGEDFSTTDLLLRLGRACGTPARLFPLPPPVLETIARFAGKSAELQRLVGSLQIDMTATKDLLSWSPPLTPDEGLARAVGPHDQF